MLLPILWSHMIFATMRSLLRKKIQAIRTSREHPPLIADPSSIHPSGTSPSEEIIAEQPHSLLINPQSPHRAFPADPGPVCTPPLRHIQNVFVLVDHRLESIAPRESPSCPMLRKWWLLAMCKQGRIKGALRAKPFYKGSQGSIFLWETIVGQYAKGKCWKGTSRRICMGARIGWMVVRGAFASTLF